MSDDAKKPISKKEARAALKQVRLALWSAEQAIAADAWHSARRSLDRVANLSNDLNVSIGVTRGES